MPDSFIRLGSFKGVGASQISPTTITADRVTCSGGGTASLALLPDGTPDLGGGGLTVFAQEADRILPAQFFGEAVAAGAPVYIKIADGDYYNAQANALASGWIFGIVLAPLPTDLEAGVPVISSGLVKLTKAEWNAIADTSEGLVRGTPYYLSATKGKLTSAILGSPNYVVPVGIALDAETLLVRIGAPVLGASS